MSETSEIFSLFMDTLEPQARFNMEMAVHIDELLRGKDGPDEVTDDLIEAMGQEITSLREEVGNVQRELKILRGAMEETIVQLREFQKRGGVEQAVRDTQQQARPGLTPKGHRSRAKQFRGIYCRNCGKALAGKHQSIFCSRKCGAQWRSKHPNEVATPRLSLKNGFDATVEAGVGVKAGSVTT